MHHFFSAKNLLSFLRRLSMGVLAAAGVRRDRLPAFARPQATESKQVPETAAEAASDLADRYRALFESTRAAVVLTRADGAILDANPAALRSYGYSLDEILTMRLQDLSMPGAEHVHHRRDGSLFPVDVEVRESRMLGCPVRMNLIRDISPEKLAASSQTVLREVDRRILHKQALSDIGQYFCSRMVELFGFAAVWVALRQADGTLSAVAVAGPEAGLASATSLAHLARGDQGPTSEAFATGLPQHLSVDEANGSSAIDLLKAHKVRSALAIPLMAQSVALGSLSLYSYDAGAFPPDMVSHLLGLADQVAISLQAARDQEQIQLQTAALEAAAHAVVITDRTGVILWVNPAWTRLTGYTLEEVLGRRPSFLKSGAHSEGFYRQMWETIQDRRSWHGELQNRRKDGSLYVDEMTITPVIGDDGEISHFIAVKQDVTDRKRGEEQLQYLASHDPLTDLPNRRTLKDRLESMVGRARQGDRGALVLLDLDNFKIVNDTLGHAEGDKLLINLAKLLRRTLRPGDTLARLGGDEFAVVLEGVELAEAEIISERLRRGVAECRFSLSGQVFDLGISVGIAPIDGTLDPHSVMILADSALYHAKEMGKNRVVLYLSEHEVGVELAEAGAWASRIRAALREGRLALYLQPVVMLRDGAVTHHEVLVRLTGEDGTVHGPSEFLGAAERFGLMPELDRWVIREALHLLEDRPELRLFVNISGQSLGDAGLLNFAEAAVRESGFLDGRISFEITETAAVKDLELARQWMLRLKALGCGFALDDFGTGFSSFNYLRELPADFVKIDGSFVRGADEDATKRSLIEAIRSVAHTLGKQVIAEWVENQAVNDALLELGVEQGQGYHWGRPAAAPEPSPQRRQRLQKVTGSAATGGTDDPDEAGRAAGDTNDPDEAAHAAGDTNETDQI